MQVKAQIMDSMGIERALKRVSHEIIEKNKGTENVVFIGIKTRGVPLANRISDIIEEFEGVRVPVGTIDITLYRDDLTERFQQPSIGGHQFDFDIKNKTIILVDDVIYTGRTVRAALDAIIDIGRPKLIQLAVLVDRGHRELPIRPDYVGKNVPTSQSEVVHVKLNETDGEDRILIAE